MIITFQIEFIGLSINWFYVGKREAPGMSVIRDPYTRSAYGEIILTYMYRLDYAVLIAEALGYGVHPSA